MGEVVTDVAIVVVHLEDEAAILNIGLAGHKEGGIVLEAPVVASVPLLGIKVFEVILPAEREVLASHVVIVDLNEVILGFPWHMGVIKVVVPW